MSLTTKILRINPFIPATLKKQCDYSGDIFDKSI